MGRIKMFKSTRDTKRFKTNQKVWIVHDFGNHISVRFKWRGSGRYVSGVCDKHAPCVGEIKEIDVDDDFIARLN
jgi:hypothetical protein